MASTFKVLGQARPANTNIAALYTVPTGGQAISSTIAVANLTGDDAKFSIYVTPSGGQTGDDTAIAKNTTVRGETTSTVTIGVTASAGDVISVKSETASALTFTAFGQEIA